MKKSSVVMALLLLGSSGLAAAAAELPAAGMFKRVQGEVRVERAGEQLPASVGMSLYPADTVVTAGDAAAGITFDDNTLMSLGPASRFVIDRFRFDPTTHEGSFESTLSKGRVAVVSGKIAKHQTDAMKLRTPGSILGVRGTEFIVEAGD
jgi:hypothetical protein